MKKIAVYLIATFTSLSAAAASKMVIQEFEIEDIYGGTHLIQRNVIKNADGSFTLIPGQRSEKLLEFHHEVCSSMGGEDITEDGITTLSSQAYDAVICHITDDHAIEILKDSSPDISKAALIGPTLNGEIIGPYLYVMPPNQTVPVNYNFTLQGSFQYRTVQGGQYSAFMQAGGCKVNSSRTLASYASGALVMQVLRHAYDPGQYASFLDVCIPGLCASGRGTIHAVPL